MAQVANVHGVKVFSDKTKTMIVNGIVFFDDGSFCDVNSRSIHKTTDTGYITFDFPPEGFEEKSPEPKIFYGASNLKVNGINANLVVLVHNENFIKVIIPADSIIAVQDGDCVEINDTSSMESGAGSIIVSSNKGSVVIGGNIGGNIVMGNQVNIVSGRGNIISTGGSISIGDSEEIYTVYVYAPTGASLDIYDVAGFVDIGDVMGSIKLRTSGSNLITIGKITDLDFKSSGSGPIDVRSVRGDVDIKLTGSGNMSIDQGVVDLLKVKTIASGSAFLHLTATDADLKSTGSGSIRVDCVTNRPSIKKTGSGGINVRNW